MGEVKASNMGSLIILHTQEIAKKETRKKRADCGKLYN
jgi:hypothetical protein